MMLANATLRDLDPLTAKSPRIREANAHEALAARLLLPELTIAGLAYTAYVATAGTDGPIIGAGGIASCSSQMVDGRLSAEVQVIAPWQGHAVETMLWATLLDNARTRGCGLLCQKWITDDSKAPPASLGFGILERKYEYTGTIQGTIDALQPIMDRLRRRGRVPHDARIVSFREADPAAVATLYVKHFPGSAAHFVASLRDDAPDPFDLEMSTVTLHGECVTGFILGRIVQERSLFDVYWKAVDEHYRNGWSNVWCMLESAIRLQRVGIKLTRFRALTHNRDTQQMTSHFGGGMAAVETRYGTDAPPFQDSTTAS